MNPPHTHRETVDTSASQRSWLRWLALALLAGATAAVCLGSIRQLEAARNVAPPESEVYSVFLVRKEKGLYRPGREQPYTGWMIERYPDGPLKSRSRILDGVLDGLSEGWHPNGQLQVREHFSRGVSHGLRLKWHSNGNRSSAARIVEGRIDGPFRRWHENGVLAEETHLRNGEPDGLARAFYESGFLKARVRLSKGHLVEKEFWPDGELRLAATALTSK